MVSSANLGPLKAINKSAAILLLASMAFLCVRLGSPRGSVLDEFHYVSGAKALYHKTPGLWHGLPDTNPEHPPLGKYLIGLGIELGGDNPTGWRLCSVLFGAITLTVIFLWVSDLKDGFTAWLAVALVLTNGFWFVMSRVAMLSIFQLCFCVIGFYLFTKDKFIWSGVSLGLAAACRWNAVFAIGLLVAWLMLRKTPQIRKAAQLLASSLIAYVVALLPAVRFRMGDFVRAQIFIFNYHKHATGIDRIAQSWFQWPFRTEPQFELNFLLANPIVLILGALAVVYLLVTPNRRLLAMAPVVFYLGWAVIPRPYEYYYYFFDSVVFLSIAAAVMLSELSGKLRWFPYAAAGVATLWFLLHYPEFTYLATPWDGALNAIKF
jgi:dolichyl-phosphate-mannose-protein mannosyltransferase